MAAPMHRHFCSRVVKPFASYTFESSYGCTRRNAFGVKGGILKHFYHGCFLNCATQPRSRNARLNINLPGVNANGLPGKIMLQQRQIMCVVHDITIRTQSTLIRIQSSNKNSLITPGFKNRRLFSSVLNSACLWSVNSFHPVRSLSGKAKSKQLEEDDLDEPNANAEATPEVQNEANETTSPGVNDPGKDMKEDRVLTIPNVLTVSRIVLSPVLGYLVVQEHFHAACGLFVIISLTDWFDGKIARTFPSQASAFGSFADPMADKILLTVLYLSLSMAGLIPVPLTALVIARDVGLVSAAFYVRYITLPPPKTLTRYFDVTRATAQISPTFLSKLNTAVQMSLVVAALGAPIFHYTDSIAFSGLCYLTAGTTIASGIGYMFAKNTFHILRQEVKKKATAHKKSA